MKCTLCKQRAVIEDPVLCKDHFTEYVENTVAETIQRFNLITSNDRIVVAASGGKDSLTLLNILNKSGYAVVALAIDEGIAPYREKTLHDLTRFCQSHNIPLHIYSYEDEFGMPLDEMLRKHRFNPCSLCGVFRRYLLNTKSRELGATKLVTGHNLDDEAQAILMNLFKHNAEVLPRSGPMTGVLLDNRFVRRVKPLYFLTEKQIMTYAFLQGLTGNFNECPNASQSFRNAIRDWLNDIEREFPGSKCRLVNTFILWLPSLKLAYSSLSSGAIAVCRQCGEPSTQELCQACLYVQQLTVLAR